MTEADHAARSHAVLSPSSAVRWMACPGSVALSKGIPERPAGPHAAEGTLAHEYAERALKQGRQVLADAPKDMADAVSVYLDHIDMLTGPGAEVFVETRVSFTDYVPHGEGTCDALVVEGDGKTLHVVDYKHGQGVAVSAENNPQLMLYAIGALSNLAFIYPGLDNVVLHVVQPRTPGEPATGQIWAADDLLEWADTTLAPAARAAWGAYNDGPADLNPGEAQCRWCPAAGRCPAQAMAALDAAAKDARLLDPHEIGPLMARTKEVRQWADAVEASVFLALNEGREVPGYKLVAGRANRKWGAADEEVLQVLKSTRKPVDDIAPRSPLSPAQAEKYFGELPAKVAALIVKGEGKPTVAPLSDKRKAIVVDVTEGFTQENEHDT